MHEKPLDAINMIPFVDIMLVLLAIVLTTSSLIATGRIPVHLPTATHTTVSAEHALVLEIARDGAVTLDGRVLDEPAWKGRLAAMDAQTHILIRTDRELPLEHFIHVVDALAAAKLTHVAVETTAP